MQQFISFCPEPYEFVYVLSVRTVVDYCLFYWSAQTLVNFSFIFCLIGLRIDYYY